MKRLVHSLTWYYAVNGLSMLLLIARMLKKMDFQPRLGVVTRSIALAGPDLLHFSVVGGLVFFGYAVMAHLIFGSSIRSFSSFGRSVNTCFEILLGDISVSAQLKELTGLQSLAGTLFFWSFELLVFLVLLNFLLAIIVDAFSVVKENTSETTNIHTEIFGMVRQKWRDFIGRMTDANYVPYDRLGAMLHRYGTLDDETNHDDDDVPKMRKSIKVGDLGERVVFNALRRSVQLCKEEIDAATMKNVLYHCLEDTTFTELLRKPVAFNSRYLTDNELFKPDDSDLDAIVSSLMQRFGTDEDDAASDDENVDREITKVHRPIETRRNRCRVALSPCRDSKRNCANHKAHWNHRFTNWPPSRERFSRVRSASCVVLPMNRTDRRFGNVVHLVAHHERRIVVCSFDMALRRLSCFSPFRVGVSWLSTVSAISTTQHIISVTLVDKEGLRHTVKGVKGQLLSDVLAEVGATLE